MTGCHGTVGWSHDITVLRLGLQVLAQAQKELLCYQTSGISIMGKLHQTLSIFFMVDYVPQEWVLLNLTYRHI